MKIYLVRHAQSLWNAGVENKDDGQLSEVGKEQAKRLGTYFMKVEIDLVICSTLKRAKETLNFIIPYLKDKKIIYTNKIIEHNIGNYAKDGKFPKKFREDAKKARKDFYEFEPKGGESYAQAFKRSKKFLLELLKKYNSKNVLVVGHASFSKYLILNILGLDISEERYFRLNNASVSTFNVDKKGKVKDFHVNDFNHILKEGIKKNGKR